MTRRDHAVALCARASLLLVSNAPEAVRLLTAATHADPTFAPPYFHLGNLIAESGALDAACVLYNKCLEIDPENVPALVNLGHREYYRGNLQESFNCSSVALELDRDNARAWTNLSLVQSERGNHENAIFSAHRGFNLGDRADPNHEMALAFAHLFAGDFATGLCHFESRFAGPLKSTQNFPWPRWAGEDISGKTLLIFADQGIGDTISFFRFVRLVQARCEKIILQVNNELLRVVSDYDRMYLGNVTVISKAQPYPQCDVWTSFMSLPFCLGLPNEEIIDTLDYEWPTYKLSTKFRRPARKHVGICWSGNPDCAIEKWRRVPLELLAPLALVPNVALYSLQVGPAAQQLYENGFSTFITDLAPIIRDVGDTLAILRELDLVITTDTAVAHMAGVLGIPCWVLAATHGGDWRIGRSEKMNVNWYPAHRIFKQPDSARWEPVIERVRDELAKL